MQIKNNSKNKQPKTHTHPQTNNSISGHCYWKKSRTPACIHDRMHEKLPRHRFMSSSSMTSSHSHLVMWHVTDSFRSHMVFDNFDILQIDWTSVTEVKAFQCEDWWIVIQQGGVMTLATGYAENGDVQIRNVSLPARRNLFSCNLVLSKAAWANKKMLNKCYVTLHHEGKGPGEGKGKTLKKMFVAFEVSMWGMNKTLWPNATVFIPSVQV